MSRKNLVYGALQRDGTDYLKTGRTTATFNIPVQSAEQGMNRDFIEGVETTGSRAQETQEPGLTRFAGSIPFFVRPDSSPFMFALAMGEPTTSTPATGTNSRDHLFEPDLSANHPLQATFWTINDDMTPAIKDKIIGAKGNEIGISVGVNQYLAATFGFIAAKMQEYTGGDTLSVAKDASRRFTYVQSAATLSITGIGSLAPLKAQDFEFSWNNNIADDLGVLGSTEVEDLPEGNVESTVGFTAAKQSELATHYRRALLTVPDDVTLRLTATGPVIEAALYNEFEITLYKAHYREAPAPINAGDTTRTIAVTARPVLDESQTPDKSIDVRFRNENTGANYLAPTS